MVFHNDMMATEAMAQAVCNEWVPAMDAFEQDPKNAPNPFEEEVTTSTLYSTVLNAFPDAQSSCQRGIRATHARPDGRREERGRFCTTQDDPQSIYYRRPQH